LSGSLAIAQTSPKIQDGRVVTDNALVYKAADFDAPVVAELAVGEIFTISTQIFNGAFYKVKVKDGVYGYISDVDIKPVSPLKKETKAKEKEEFPSQEARKRNEPPKKKKQKGFEWEHYRGLQVAQIGFREDTMGDRRTDSMLFYGVKVSGQDVLAEGSYVDGNLLFHFGAPKYYADATGKSANGFGMIADLLWQIANPQGKDTLVIWGFGPMLKYTKWDVALDVGGREEAYELTDITLGAAFNLGIAQRFESFALRGEIQYYWEKMQYFGFSLSIQLPF
jgi:hypothetical protein